MVLTILLFYIFCVICSWNYIHISHSKNGEYYGLNPDSSDLFFTLTPIFNIVPACLFIKNIINIKFEINIEKILLKFYRIKK